MIKLIIYFIMRNTIDYRIDSIIYSIINGNTYIQCSAYEGTQGDGVPQLIFRNFIVPLLLLRYNHNAQPVLGRFFFLK
jgi:hypothetical protein